MNAGDGAVEIGDRGKERRPGLQGNVLIGAVKTARMEAQRARAAEIGDAAAAEIGLGERASDRLAHGK